MAKIPTVAIWDPQSGRRVINAHEYNPAIHDLYEDQGAVKPAPPVEAEPGPAPVYSVEQRGPWWMVIGPDGERVGKSQRTEADAVQLLREVIADGD